MNRGSDAGRDVIASPCFFVLPFRLSLTVTFAVLSFCPLADEKDDSILPFTALPFTAVVLCTHAFSCAKRLILILIASSYCLFQSCEWKTSRPFLAALRVCIVAGRISVTHDWDVDAIVVRANPFWQGQ